jgi:small subunit ribosomal protein S1
MSSEDIKQPETETAEATAIAVAAEPLTTTPTEVAETAATEATTTTTKPEINLDDHAAEELDFGAILDQYEQETSFRPGQAVNGKVISVSDNGITVDFGYKSEGIVPTSEFTNENGEVTVKAGDQVEVVFKSMDGGDGAPALSYLDAQKRKAWEKLESAAEENQTVTAKVLERIKGGYRVDISGAEGFLPASQVDSRPIGNPDEIVGQELEVKIIKFSRRKGNLVVSRKVISDEINTKQRVETLSQLEEGYVVEGKVKSLTEYGAFVDIGGLDGLLHAVDMSWGKMQKPSEMIKVGEQVQVKILKLDREKGKVSLGMKQLMPDPWSSIQERIAVGSTLRGKVSSVTEYGAFVELEPGIEGLVHVTEMSWSKRSKTSAKLVNQGDEIDVKVLDVNPTERRISLSIKQLLENPWDTVTQRLRVGDKVSGQVRNLTDFGAFVEIEDGIDGLVHVSDISWSKRVKHPKDALKKGQDVEAVVTNIDTAGRRISLSIKDTAPSALDTFMTDHKPGDVVKGIVTRFAGFGVFVELGEDLEGLCHISELSDEKVDRPENVVQLGQEMEFKILRIELDQGKIGLSARAVGKEDEPVIDTRAYTTKAKGGMASLGELASLKPQNSDED